MKRLRPCPKDEKVLCAPEISCIDCKTIYEVPGEILGVDKAKDFDKTTFAQMYKTWTFDG